MSGKDSTNTSDTPAGAGGGALPKRPPMDSWSVGGVCVRCWRHKPIRWLLIVLFSLVLGLFVLGRTPVTKVWLLPQIEAAIDADIEAGSVALTVKGGVVLRDVVFRVRGLDGPAAEFLRASKMTASVNYGGGGRPEVTRIVLDEPRVRLSINVDGESVNVALLGGSGQKSEELGLPEILVHRGVIELGEHDDVGGYTALKSLYVDGALLPSEAGRERMVVIGDRFHRATGGYEVELRELDASGNPKDDGSHIDVSGTVTKDSLIVTVNNFSLDAWPASSAPSIIREQFEQLDLEGTISSARFGYTLPDVVVAELELEKVAVSLPFVLPSGGDGSGDGSGEGIARMRGVSGTIRFSEDGLVADLVGQLEDLPYQVRLEYEGLDTDSPFTAELATRGFRLEERPELLPFVPQLVRDRLDSFTNPTATVDGLVTITRGAVVDGEPGLIDVRGWIEFNDAAAAYDRFPYRFENLTGLVLFDSDSIELVELSGTSSDGATIFAQGTFAPVGPDAAVDLRIRVERMPLGDRLREALGEKRQVMISSLFNEDRYEELVADGVTVSSVRLAEARTELVEAERGLARAHAAEASPSQELVERVERLRAEVELPVFDYGGVIDVDVKVNRELGKVSVWSQDIRVWIENVGILPEHFPLPLVAESVVLQIDDDSAVVKDGKLRPLSGGSARIDARIDLRGKGAAGQPQIDIKAMDVPVDNLVIRAIPDPAKSPEASVRRMLTELNVGARVDADASIGPRSDGSIGYDVGVRFGEATIRPGPATNRFDDGTRLELADCTGLVEVNEDRIELSLSGRAERVDEHGGRSDSGRMEVDASIDLHDDAERDEPGVHLAAMIDGRDIDAMAPVEDLVWIFSQSAGDSLVGLRSVYAPEGRVDTRTTVSGNPALGLESEVEITGARELSFDWLGGRARFTRDDGRVVVRAGVSPMAEFEGLSGPCLFDGFPAGRAWLDGEMVLRPSNDSVPIRTDAVLFVNIAGTRFQSPIVDRSMHIQRSDGVLKLYEKLEPKGVFDAELRVRPAAAYANTNHDVGLVKRYSPVIEGDIFPRTLEFTYAETPIRFGTTSGTISFGPGLATLDRFAGKASGWSMSVDGSILTEADSTTEIDLVLSVQSEGVPTDLAAMMPIGLKTGLAAVKAEFDGSVELEDVHITGRRPPDPTNAWLRATGVAHFENASAIVGAKVTRANGSAWFDTNAPGWPGEVILSPLPTPDFELHLTAESCLISGVQVTDASARMVTSNAAMGMKRPLLVPQFSGHVHGGLISGQAELHPRENGELSPEFSVGVRASGVRLTPVFDDFAAARGDEVKRDTNPDSRGRMDGEISVSGIVGVQESWRGRGRMFAEGGAIVSLPLITPLMEVGNLAVPRGSELDVAYADFYVDGDVFAFENITVNSETLLLLGYGTMSWPGKELDLRFRTKRKGRIPIISSLVESLRDELIIVRVRGLASKPEVDTVGFSTTRKMLGSLVGVGKSEQERRLTEIERQALERFKRARGGERRGAEPVRPNSPGR